MKLEFENLSKAYGGVKALQNVNLSVSSGEIRALLGGNGSGKSTLIKIAAGLIHSDQGSILIDGVKVKINSPKAAKKLGLIATSQELSILQNLSVGENIALCAVPKTRVGFIDQREIRRRSREILNTLGIGEQLDQPIKNLALNEQYLVELGKAMFQDFDVLMIDEVTSALYEKDVEIVKIILNGYKEQGKIILFVSHRMKEIRDICDTVTVMRNGQIIETCRVEDTDDDYLLSLMIGEKKQLHENKAAVSADTVDYSDAEEHISIRNLPIRSYGTMIDLSLKKGEIVGVAGLQGHGQTDIVRCLHGLYGNINMRVNGEELTIQNPQDAVRNGIAFVSGDRELEGSFRQHNLSENITAVEELTLKRKIPNAVDVLNRLNVKYADEKQNIISLSGGNQQKVIFGRWICTNPVLLLADDPSKGIDAHARMEMQGMLKELSDAGTSMIIVSSDDDELEKLCEQTGNSRVIVMYEGKIATTLYGKEITRDNIISASHAVGREAQA